MGSEAPKTQDGTYRRGRFAPSPSGPLHLGSLYTAVASFLDARHQGGEWLLRIEDVDGTRTRPGAESAILSTLEAFGLEWDGPILRQSERTEAYEAALARLRAQGRLYACRCSRSDLTRAGASEHGAYPGYCRDLHLESTALPDTPVALRFRRVPAHASVRIDDRLQGVFEEAVDRSVGDFILKRRDGFVSYQLAVVVDDAHQGITDVVRGRDLLDNTPRQRLLQEALGLPTPTTLHVPLILEGKDKLSKSHQALPADPARAPELLSRILQLLAIPMPKELQHAAVHRQLEAAIELWNPERLRGVIDISYDLL